MHALEIPVLISVPLVLVLCAVCTFDLSAFASVFVAILALLYFFFSFETSRVPLNQIMPIVVLTALAVAGRILFAAVPDVKPVTAIVIIAGAMFGKRSGFMVGALAALVSNMFFGQGPWTPWQMYVWGLVGYIAGVCANKVVAGKPFFERTWVLCVFGFLAALLFGFILNTWYVVGYVHPLTWQAVVLGFAAAIPMDMVHAVATVVFLLALYAPWKKKLLRIKRKYSLGD